ncbi:hypothetical protein [Pedosphaera parvula]|uniref:Yip1 domain-containing protein n=1 Tax=Pedosphaera parvula (strain Ellin514) TaxID=320771 RepID=B9XIR7_PEDPL|nr:hypothetical protein [Pedosphaera parvula]EEF60330.1 hypothetical protein Cflav_PD3026 [Pedosphaera parvula Ellin514]
MNGNNPETFGQTPAGNNPILPPSPPLIPSANASALVNASFQPLGSHPSEQVPITGIISAVEAILRQPRRVLFQLKQPNASRVTTALLIIAILCSLIYGIIVGTFSGGQQLWAAPVKIAAGLLIAGLICLPSLYIFSCLGGSQARLAEVFGLVAGLMTLMTVLLVGFAPVAWVFSQSTKSAAVMGTMHLGFWLVATIFGVRFMNSGFRYLGSKSEGGLRIWVVIFILVALQMTTALRPLIGTSDRFLPPQSEKKFFISHWLDCMKSEDRPNAVESSAAKY